MSDTGLNKYYSQNDEERVILEYFGSGTGTLVDIGSNDGTTFSNSARLIELGWSAHLVEPHREAYEKACNHYQGNDKVKHYNLAINTENQSLTFHAGSDSMLSSIHAEHKDLWPTTIFEERTVNVVDWKSFLERSLINTIDFLSIDAEGCDWDILQQIDLDGVRLLCIEVGDQKDEIKQYCRQFGMRVIHRTFENLIFAR